MTTFGTHNLHDETGEPTPFADVLLFTEAIPARVSEALPLSYVVAPCPWQRDLVIAWRRDVFTPKRNRRGRIVKHYRLAHGGLARVTPHRGTYWINGWLSDGTPATLLVEHRINAAFPPYVRGERWLRPRFWRRHTRITLRIIKRRLERGAEVFAGGDQNTPYGVSAYQGVLREVGAGYDRLGSSRWIKVVEVLGSKGSDHPRLRASV